MGTAEAHERVLIVDDDEVSCRVTALLFQARGWNVETACDLDSAIDAAMRQQPHIIVTELLLPDVQTSSSRARCVAPSSTTSRSSP